MGKRIGVLAGGNSPERDVSLVSGRTVFGSLAAQQHTVQLIEILDLDHLVAQLVGVDVVFNCLHGGAGEDGTVRLLLDVMEIECIGSDALACARAMDKAQAKCLFRAAGVPTPDDIATDPASVDEHLHEALDTLAFPLIVKPQSGGSTLGVHLVETPEALRQATASVLSSFDRALVEPFIPGRELTVGILCVHEEDIALPVIEIRFASALFDYHAKYEHGCAEFLAPAPLPDAIACQVQEVALQAHHALGCRGFSRVDLRLAEDDTPYVLEVNALPGMTPMSDLPRAAAIVGISYEQLVEIMLSTATLG